MSPERRPTLVFPAEAGIQRRTDWTSASAGMTSYLASCFRERNSEWERRRGSRRGLLRPFELGDHVLAEQLNGLHDLFVGNGLRLRHDHHLIDPGGLVLLKRLDTAIGVAGDDHAPVSQRIGIEIIPDLVGRRGSPRQVEHI